MNIKTLSNRTLTAIMETGGGSYHTWGNDTLAHVCTELNDVIGKSGGIISINGVMYKITYHEGGGRGMGEYPPEYRVEQIKATTHGVYQLNEELSAKSPNRDAVFDRIDPQRRYLTPIGEE